MERGKVTKFLDLDDREVISYLMDHFHELEVGEAPAGQEELLLGGLSAGTLAIERHEFGFAIIARANRKHPGAISFIRIPPEADLMFLYISSNARGKLVGSAFLAQIQEKYMDGQAMIAVCVGVRRKRFFERGGFLFSCLTHEGHNYMVCPLRTPS
jgi:GNAT superfamily N-acetyltransferase